MGIGQYRQGLLKLAAGCCLIRHQYITTGEFGESPALGPLTPAFEHRSSAGLAMRAQEHQQFMQYRNAWLRICSQRRDLRCIRRSGCGRKMQQQLDGLRDQSAATMTRIVPH